jgi:hypothetical protein
MFSLHRISVYSGFGLDRFRYTNKIDRVDIIEILLKVALNTINLYQTTQ